MPSVPYVGGRVGMAVGAMVVQHSAALGTKTPLGRGEAVAEHPSGATALTLGSSFAALSPSIAGCGATEVS